MLHEGVCRALPAMAEGCLNERDRQKTIFGALFSATSVEKLWLSNSPMECLEAQRLYYAKLHQELGACPGYMRFVRRSVVMDLLAVTQLGALELPELHVNSLMSKYAVDPSICPLAICRQKMYAAKKEANAKFREAAELLHQARDKMLQGVDIARTVGLVLVGGSELMNRTVWGL